MLTFPDCATGFFRCPCGQGVTVDIVMTDHDLGGYAPAIPLPPGWSMQLPYVESPNYDSACDGERSGQLRVRCPDHRDVENFS